MSCKTAMINIEDVFVAGPDDTAGEALSKLLENGIRAMPIVDAQGDYLGMFHFRHILKLMLPEVARIEGGLDRLDFLTGTDDQVPERLMELHNYKVKDVMDDERPVLHEDDVFWAAVLMIYKFDAPMAVVQKGTRRLVGIVTKQSMIEDLKKRHSAKTVLKNGDA